VQIKLNNINEYTRELEIDIPWESIETEFNRTLKQFSKKIKMPGFRSGRIPRDRVLSQFQSNIEAEFMEQNFQRYYIEALQKEKLSPVNKAEIKDVSFRMNEPFVFKAVFEIEPEIKIPTLKKGTLSINRIKYIHDGQDIDDAILQLRKSKATIASIDDGAKEGDYLVCDLQKLDKSGVAIIGKKFEKQYLRVGNGSFTDNQKEKLIGLKPGQTAIVNIPTGENKEESDYELKVDNIEREILPEINSEFLKQINPRLDSLDALKIDVENKIKENFEERSSAAYEKELTDAFIDFVNPSFAPSMVENYLANIIADVKKQNKGEPLEEEKVREHYKPLAERNIKWFTLRNIIIEQEGLNATNEDVLEEIENLIKRTPQSEKEIRKFYKKPSNKKKIQDDLIEKKILEYLEQFAKVNEMEVPTKDLREKENENR